MIPTWPFLELFAFLGLFRFCAALRAEIEHWLFWILGMVFSLGKQSVIAMFSFALRHHPLLWEVSWALKQFLQSLPIIGLIPISIVTPPQRNLWLWLTSWNLPPHRFLIPGLMFLLIACDGMALISAWDRQGFRSHPIVMPSSDFWEMLKPVRPYVSLQMMAFFSITFGGKMLRGGTSNVFGTHRHTNSAICPVTATLQSVTNWPFISPKVTFLDPPLHREM